MRQYAGYASARDTNQRFKFLMDQGQTGLSVAFDLPTQIGYDADDPLVKGEVGKVGVSISSLDDMAQLTDICGQTLKQEAVLPWRTDFAMLTKEIQLLLLNLLCHRLPPFSLVSPA